MVVVLIGVACVVILLISWAWKLMTRFWLNPRKLERCLRQQGLKGNSYKFLFGDLKDISKIRREAREKPIPFSNDYLTRIFPFEHQLANKYGKNCFSWLGPVPVINITDAELIREVFIRINDFQRPRLNPLTGLLAPGLASYEGEKWATHRKILNLAFRLEKLKLMLPAFCTSIMEMINKWEKIVPETGSSEVDVWPHLSSLAADVISRAAFGSSYEEGRRIFQLLREQSEHALRLAQSVYIPGWKYVPTKNNKRMKELNAQIQALLKGIIDKRKKAMEAGEAAKEDLLGILMHSNFKETQNYASNKQQKGMSFHEMIDECKLFYFAGQETTSVLLAWTMILLGKHQDWQTRAREEVLATFGKDQPDFDGLNHLKIVTMILYEVLRLYPAVVSLSRRAFDSEKQLGNISVPPGAIVSLSILNAHQDPELWGEDAKEFKPERFSEGIAKATRGHNSFFPFGCGPRICIGQNFGMAEAKMAMAIILQRFAFEVSPSYAHAPISVITLKPQYGAHVILSRI